MKLQKGGHLLLFLLVGVFFTFNFLTLKGGLVLGEPDEITHQELVNNLHRSLWPASSGGPWYYQLPGYALMAYPLSFFFPENFLSLRLVSLFSALVLLITGFLYFGKFVSRYGAYQFLFLLIFSPFIIFYSRIGMLDGTMVSLSFSALMIYDWSQREKKTVLALIAGLLLALAILTKYSAIIFLVPVFILFIYQSGRFSLASLRTNGGLLSLELRGFTTLVVALFLVGPVFLILYRHDPYLFKLHLMTNFGLLRDFWYQRSHDFSFRFSPEQTFWWLTGPVSIFSLGGLVFGLRQFRKWFLFWLTFILCLVGLVYKSPFYPRYFLLTVPFFIFFAVLFLSYLQQRFLINGRWAVLLLFLISVGMLPGAQEAFDSSRHTLIERTAARIKKAGLGTNWIFATYWPNFFRFMLPQAKVGWLADSAWEAGAFADVHGQNSLEILQSEGGAALVESLYSVQPIFQNPTSRIEARRQVTQNRPVSYSVYDDSPNFPHFRTKGNRIDVYLYEEK